MISRTPNICHFFIPSKNLDIILSEESVSSEKKAIFQCPKCHYEWSWQFSTWLKYALCPCCGFDGENKSEKKNQKIVQKFNIKTLKQIVKNIEDFWDYEKNQGLTPSSVSHGSNKSVWLKCDKGHSFSRKVYSISDNSRKIVVCPYCTNSFSKITPGVNDLFTVCKPAKEMWDHERNQEIKDPTKLSYSSREKAWFNCKNNHSFRKSIITFFKTPECPTCKFEKNLVFNH
ncbi:zinc-ribbon domain-containing protein [Enterococcus avium]|uniref:zinc-ribbon domain-containing protein n=1 Tax=Enterococcus avium TaxID=33945 RepID=UPI0032E44F78